MPVGGHVVVRGVLPRRFPHQPAVAGEEPAVLQEADRGLDALRLCHDERIDVGRTEEAREALAPRPEAPPDQGGGGPVRSWGELKAASGADSAPDAAKEAGPIS